MSAVRQFKLRGAVRLALIGAMLSAPAGAGAQPPPSAPETVDRETAERYDEFCKTLSARLEAAAGGLTRRYELDDDQQKAVRDMVAQSRDRFLREHGRRAFDFFQRMGAVRDHMRQEQVRWPDLPADIRQDVAGGAMPLVEAFTRQLTAFADGLADVLDDDQRQQLAADRKQMEMRLEFARRSIQAMGSGAPPAGPAPATRAARRPLRPGDLTRPDRWERYVREFIRRYRLDEVQKVRALDLLSRYRTMAKRRLGGEAQSRPATQPASGPATRPATAPAGGAGSVAELRGRLARLAERRRRLRELFERLKAELEKIPSPVQRRLAEEEPTRPAATRPARQPPARAGQPNRDAQ